MKAGRSNFCYSCNRTEHIPVDFYRVCAECGHVYKTPDQLVGAWNHAVLSMGVDEYKTSDEADTIWFCQECCHDF